MNKELSQNIEIFLDKLDIDAVSSGDDYNCITACHSGDSRGLSIFLGTDGYYRFKCWSHSCESRYNHYLTDLGRCILEERTGKKQSYTDVKKFFEDVDLKSYAEFKKKFTDPKLIYAAWKNIKNGYVFRHLTSYKEAFLPIFLDDTISGNVGLEVKNFMDVP